MQNIAPLIKQAIEAAKNKDWNLAIKINEEILEIDFHNIGALNRLALARMQLGHIKVAEKYLKQVLEIDKHNKIASKNLTRVQKRCTNPVVNFGKSSPYIEEPGKAQIIELIRAADKKVLNSASVGQACCLQPKKELISAYLVDEDDETKINYLGALPQEISARLIKLINSGNEYQCAIHSVNPETSNCRILVKELKVSPVNQGTTSFPISKQSQTELLGDLSTEYLAQDSDEENPIRGLNDEDDEELVELDDDEEFD